MTSPRLLSTLAIVLALTTQAAAVAGAPLTNLTSMYLSVYWNSGSTDARIFEISQGRMEVPFWEDVDSYIANSPVFHVDNLNTPLLVAHGTEDGAVDYNQDVEYYTLSYNGEMVRPLPQGRAGRRLDHQGRSVRRSDEDAEEWTDKARGDHSVGRQVGANRHPSPGFGSPHSG